MVSDTLCSDRNSCTVDGDEDGFHVEGVEL